MSLSNLRHIIMDYAKELAELGIVCKNGGKYMFELILYKKAVAYYDESVVNNSDALLIPNRVERLNALGITSIYLDHAVKWKEKTWMELLRCTVGEEGIQERKLQQEQWNVWINNSKLCDENCENCKHFKQKWIKIKTTTNKQKLKQKWDELCNEFEH
jgi:hypothetical protein